MTPEKTSPEQTKKVERGIASEIVGYAVLAGLAVGGILAFVVGCVFNGAEGVKKGLDDGEEKKCIEGEAVRVDGKHKATERAAGKPRHDDNEPDDDGAGAVHTHGGGGSEGVGGGVPGDRVAEDKISEQAQR